MSEEKPTKRKSRGAGQIIERSQGPMLQIFPKRAKAPRRNQRIPCVPNPWPPSEVTVLIVSACMATAAKPVLELIKTWLDYRKNRKIRIKNGDVEIEIQ